MLKTAHPHILRPDPNEETREKKLWWQLRSRGSLKLDSCTVNRATSDVFVVNRLSLFPIIRIIHVGSEISMQRTCGITDYVNINHTPHKTTLDAGSTHLFMLVLDDTDADLHNDSLIK